MPIPTDKHNYEKAILEFSQTIEEGIELAKDIKPDGDFSSAAICGMGASSVATELISSVARSEAPLLAVRQYELPREVNKNTLVIVSSYSGNTEETLSCYAAAKENELKIVALSKNGKLEEQAKEAGDLFLKYPDKWEGYQPRWGVGYSIAALTKILENAKLFEGLSLEFLQAAKQLDVSDLKTKGKELANILFEKEPAVYGPMKLGYLARYWQMNLNEDAKIPASWNNFPETNHYETTGYTQTTGNRAAVIIKDPDEIARISERMEITATLLKEKNVETSIVELPEGSREYKILYGIVLAMWTSYHLAAMYKIDPAPTEMVEKLKKMLS